MKYLGLGLYFLSITGKVDEHIKKVLWTIQYYHVCAWQRVLWNECYSFSQNILSRLPTLTYGCENAVFCENTKRKLNVAWNNIVSQNIFKCCWRESVKPLQYFCGTLPMTCHIDQNKLLLFWKKMYTSDNLVLYLYSLSRLVYILNSFAAVGCNVDTATCCSDVSSLSFLVLFYVMFLYVFMCSSGHSMCVVIDLCILCCAASAQ